jgi:ABC-type ATPase involved in cell division
MTSRSSFDRAARARDLLSEMGLENRMEQYPNQLSAGERQSMATARALVNHPDIQLADEPAGNLDGVSSWQIMEILIGIQKKRDDFDRGHARERDCACGGAASSHAERKG